MTAQRDPDTILAAWLDEGPTDLPDVTRRAIVTALPTTTQARRGPFAPWRLHPMNGFSRLAAVAIVAAVAIGGAVYLLGPRLGPGGPSPTPTVTPLPSATAAQPSIGLVTFTSTQYGYTVSYPSNRVSFPATTAWPADEVPKPGTTYVDFFDGGDSTILAGIAAQPVPDGMSAQEWMVDVAERLATSGRGCTGPASAWTDTTVAGSPARRIEAPCGGGTTVEYLFVIDGVGYNIGAPLGVIEILVGSFQP